MFYNTDSVVRWGLMKERKAKEFLLESTESAKSIAGSLTTLEVMKNFNPKIKSLSSWWDVPGREKRVGSSFGNEAEVEALLILLDYIRSSDELKAEDIDLGKVGVTSFYTGQIHAIKDAVDERFPDWITEGLEIASINAFQGREKDIMLISLVRANDCDEVGILNKQHRICTVLSRARICQIIVRNFDFIRNQIRRKFDGIKLQERKAIVEAGRVHELQGGKHVGQPLSTLLRDHKWNRFRDDRINPFLGTQEEAEMERFEEEA
ncbi:ATP-dependent helicase NAM7 [Orbilia oligospora]|nr:ATP-dependent helicase NAM7 [Orbilia oligospora]